MRDYNLYLEFDTLMDLNVNDDFISPTDHIFADILHETHEAVRKAMESEEEEEIEGTRIGFINMKYYNQALAMDYKLNMTDFRGMSSSIIGNALLDLDYTRIGEQTIEAIGMASNPNIMILHHFGIKDGWRNKGIGEQALKGLVKQLKGQCGYVIFKSEPPQYGRHSGPDSLYEKQGIQLATLEKDPEKAQVKLNAFFQRCGFKPFKDHKNILICNVDQAVPERMMVKPKSDW